MSAPLADKIRPKTLDDVVGQEHILGINKPLRKIIESGHIPNLIFYGPSGVGKTTVAGIIAENCGMSLYKLNGTNATIADIKDVIADIGTFAADNGILLYLDEIQYFNKKQQQSLLEYLENGKILVKYPNMAKAVTPGQACVLYQNEVCLGSGIIEEVHKNNQKLWYL